MGDPMFPLNLPNVLTVLRIMLVPVLVVALLGNTPAGDVLAAVVFALASLTDFIDGYLARARGSITTFGKLMDPLADKLLIVAALIALVSLHRLAAWVAMVIITRELAVTVLRLGATPGRRGDGGEHVRQGQDLPADRRDPRGDRRAWAAVMGIAAAVRDGAGDRTVRPGLLLRATPPHAAGASSAGRLSTSARAQPLFKGRLTGREHAGVDLSAQLGEQAVTLGDHVVLVDRL